MKTTCCFVDISADGCTELFSASGNTVLLHVMPVVSVCVWQHSNACFYTCINNPKCLCVIVCEW